MECRFNRNVPLPLYRGYFAALLLRTASVSRDIFCPDSSTFVELLMHTKSVRLPPFFLCVIISMMLSWDM